MTPEERDDAIIQLLRENASSLRALEERAENIAVPPEHQQQHQWLALAIQREAQRVALRQSIIDKTLTGLIWMGLVGLGAMFMTYIEAHGWKK